MMSLSESAAIVKGSMTGADVTYASVSIDTRTLQKGGLFVAILGDRFDGHDFVSAAEASGAVAAVLSRRVETRIPFIIVDDTRLALGRLAGAWRGKLAIPVIGITGSNGKTTVKEMTAGIFAQRYNVLYTIGNLNNDIGVPLTLFRLDEDSEIAVIEMGANHAGEISYTSSLAVPDVAIITNAGAAHLEGFGSVDGVARAKAEIVENLHRDGTAVLNGDDQYIPLWRQIAGNRRVVTFGFGEDCDVRATDVLTQWTAGEFATRFLLHYRDTEHRVRLKLPGRHNVRNALAAASAAMILGVDLEEISRGLQQVKPVTGRMQPLVGLNGSCLIDDTYNANPSSFYAAIDVLSEIDGEKIVVIGSFAELGDCSWTLHTQIGEYARSKGVSRLFVTGQAARAAAESFGAGGDYFDAQTELIDTVCKFINKESVVLVKGSRSQKMERVIKAIASLESG